MAYLRKRDYNSQIQSTQLAEITSGGDDSIRLAAERTAQEEISTYLRQRWDIADEFRDTVLFSLTAIYKAKQLVELDFPAYVPATAYVINNLVTQSGIEYICIASTTGVFDASKWTKIGVQYDLFYIPLPYPEFDYKAVYSVGDKVWWKDKVYECIDSTIISAGFSNLQFGTYDLVPSNNAFPDSKANGKNQWKPQPGTSYSFTGLLPNDIPTNHTAWSGLTPYIAGVRVNYQGVTYQAFAASTNVAPGTDITKWNPVSWVSGDNRNQQLYIYMIRMALYHIYCRVAPRNIPQFIEDGYNIAKDWLKDAAYAKVNPDLTLIQPWQGNTIRSGGNIKKANDY